MKFRELLDKWSLNKLSITAGFLNMEWQPNDTDKQCAWEMYVELLTRITTQPLADEHGDEKTALASIHSLFATTRNILKDNGRHCQEFSKISIVVLNQIIRPFTAKWHKHALAGELDSTNDENGKRNADSCRQFRAELADLQAELTNYSKLLADMAGVEDLTRLEG